MMTFVALPFPRGKRLTTFLQEGDIVVKDFLGQHVPIFFVGTDIITAFGKREYFVRSPALENRLANMFATDGAYVLRPLKPKTPWWKKVDWGQVLFTLFFTWLIILGLYLAYRPYLAHRIV